MRSPGRTPFVAVFQNEVLLNTKRVAPYALMILFIANAVLWWRPACGPIWVGHKQRLVHCQKPAGFLFLTGTSDLQRSDHG